MNPSIEVFGNYVLLEKLASGGMAEIFLARPATREGDGRLLVVKRVLPHIATQSEFINMFQREIQIIMGFNHANVVQLHDFGAANSQPYIAMEYIEGESLRNISERLRVTDAKMPIPTALSLIAQAASGLHYAHTFEHKITGKPLNTIHRDISPHNLLVSLDGNLKVIDFGIAKAAGSMLDLTKTGTIKGKIGYFSPEQLEGKNIDPRTDIFSLGVVAWELLVGDRLFAKAGDSEVNIMVKLSQCEKHVVPPSSLNPEIPHEVDHIILTALQKDPNDRFRDAREFQGALRKVMLKLYPDYSYADTGELVKSLFSVDIMDQRKKTQELNHHAQELLAKSVDDSTTVLASEKKVDTAANEKNLEEVMTVRLSKIEAALKQKASTRHYLLLAFYVVSIIALKFEDLRNIWNGYVTPAGVAKVTTASSTSTRPAAAGIQRAGSPAAKKK